MPGLVPGIHVFRLCSAQGVDGRDQPGHYGVATSMQTDDCYSSRQAGPRRPAAHAQPAADFKGETISISMGYPPGGAPDAYFRVLAKHYGRHIPGNPAVVAKNMQGAGGLRAANYLYNAAPKNGTELANFGPSAAMEPLLGNDQAKFDAAKFCWIGSITQELSFCGIWQRPGAADLVRGHADPGDALRRLGAGVGRPPACDPAERDRRQ